MLRLAPIIFVLAFALLLQNTCPHGFAGKTSVVKSCGNCSMKQVHSLSPDGQNKISSASSISHPPLFIFAVPKTIPTFELYPVKNARLLLDDTYVDALPDGLLRPPQA